MKKYILLFCMLLYAVFISAQQVQVLDKSTKIPVVDAMLQDKSGKQSFSDKRGYADISGFSGDTMMVMHPAYGSSRYSIADAKSSLKVLLTARVITIGEVVLSANRKEEKMDDVPAKIEVIKSRDVEFSNPQTSADMLTNSGQVFVQKSQQGGGSPVLRGFESSRVLLVIDGVRMNNAIYRAGHLQDVITIDPNMLDRTEVIFGPSSSMYGSDALGGVMHFYTKKPIFGDDKMFVMGNAYVRYSSASNENTAHIDANLGWKKFAWLLSYNYSDFGDLRSGHLRSPLNPSFGLRPYYVDRINGKDTMMVNEDPNVQKYSGYKQYDITNKFLFSLGDSTTLLLNTQYSTTSDIPRYDRLTQMSGNNLRFAEWYYGPQQRLFVSATVDMKKNSALYDDARIIAAFQNIGQDRITRRFNNNFRISQMETVNVMSLNADLHKVIAPKHELRYGIEITSNIVSSEAEKRDIVADTATADITRYPDGGSNMMTAALYGSYSYEISEKAILSAGVRVTSTSLKSEWSDTTFYPFPFKEVAQKNFSPSGNLGLVLMPCKGWRITLNGSTGFRAPNVDDMTKVFESAPGTLIIPNPDVKPEMVYNGEIGIRKTFSNFSIEAGYFHTIAKNYMVLKDAAYNGSDSVLFDGTMSKVQSMQNADDAKIQGIWASFSADFDENFSMRSTFNYTYGRYHDVGNDTIVPLDHIAPIFGQTGLVYHAKNIEMEFFTRYNGWKHLADYSPSGEDNLAQATAVGMPAWATLNVRGAYQITKILRLSMALENITDLHYRYFASGISAPGRNFIVSLRARF